MHPQVERLPSPTPDYRRFLQVSRREIPDRVPLIELAIRPEVVSILLDERMPCADAELDQRVLTERSVRAHHRLGYDVVKVSAQIPWAVPRLAAEDASALSSGTRRWADEGHGPIGNWEELERFLWPRPESIDWAPVETAVEVLPDGMALIGFVGGILEFCPSGASQRFVVAYERFSNSPPPAAATRADRATASQTTSRPRITWR